LTVENIQAPLLRHPPIAWLPVLVRHRRFSIMVVSIATLRSPVKDKSVEKNTRPCLSHTSPMSRLGPKPPVLSGNHPGGLGCKSLTRRKL